MSDPSPCATCGKSIPDPKPTVGRPKLYCSPACRTRGRYLVRIGRAVDRRCGTCRFWLGNACHHTLPTPAADGHGLWPLRVVSEVCDSWRTTDRRADPAVRLCRHCGWLVGDVKYASRRVCSDRCREHLYADAARGESRPEPEPWRCGTCRHWSAGECRAVPGRIVLTLATDGCGAWAAGPLATRAGRPCAGCDGVIPGDAHRLQRYCSQECRTRSDIAATKERRAKKRVARTCAGCDATIPEGASRRQKFCSTACYDRARYQRLKQSPPTPSGTES